MLKQNSHFHSYLFGSEVGFKFEYLFKYAWHFSHLYNLPISSSGFFSNELCLMTQFEYLNLINLY